MGICELSFADKKHLLMLRFHNKKMYKIRKHHRSIGKTGLWIQLSVWLLKCIRWRDSLTQTINGYFCLIPSQEISFNCKNKNIAFPRLLAQSSVRCPGCGVTQGTFMAIIFHGYILQTLVKCPLNFVLRVISVTTTHHAPFDLKWSDPKHSHDSMQFNHKWS